MPNWDDTTKALSEKEKETLEKYIQQKKFSYQLSMVGALAATVSILFGIYSVQRQTQIVVQTKAEIVNVRSASDYLESGRAFYDQGRYVDAIAQYKKAIDADPTDAVAYHLMGYSLYLTKQYQAAKTAYETAISLSADGPWIRYNASLVYWALGDKAGMLEQIRNLKRIEVMNKDDRMIKMLKGDRQFRKIKKMPEVIAIIGR